ncbi:hypothetical protein VTN77DRAFT_6854 [Rasamsonia byssochlamydoides]|uniref:uncharacterized protein n=1 Tax=Rasamsonia byssochlamydoides TaxID=89139 RepID=UPI00374335DA
MSLSLSNKVILITGASKGIGKATAQRVARAGASVVINYRADAAAAEALVQEIGPDRALAVQADVSKLEDINRLVDAAVQRFGRIDVVIPNAAVMPMRDLASTTEEDFDRTFALNVKGPYFLVQAASRHIPPGGRVILVSSSVTALSSVQPTYLLYASTKGAIEQMARVLAKDLGRQGILVNAVAPGPTGTELFFQGKSPELVSRIAGFSPFNRIGEPEDIAGTIAFLCGDDSAWLSGQVVRINGAMA